jgi:uncharacterized protein (DUF2336 family)
MLIDDNSQPETAPQRLYTARRLIDVIGWPESRLPPIEKQLLADVLLPLVRSVDAAQRRRCAEQLAKLRQPPSRLTRLLALDEIEVAAPLLEAGAIDELALLQVAAEASPAHLRILAARKELPTAVCDLLARSSDAETLRILLSNRTATLSEDTIEWLLGLCEAVPDLPRRLIERPEMQPAQGASVFWAGDHAVRVRVLQRFAADRAAVLAELGELIREAHIGNWTEPAAMAAVGFLERRQRRRDPAELTLEALIGRFAEHALHPLQHVPEIAGACGLTPLTVERILEDSGGEALAVLAKSVGLKWPFCQDLWTSCGRETGEREDRTTPFGRLAYVFDTLPTAKAQTMLRYWNWRSMAELIARGA